MTASINASTSSGLVLTSDLSGNLALQSNGTTVATATSTGFNLPANNTINAANTFGFKNRIINGAIVIDQRNSGASVTNLTSALYTVDRWAIYGGVASKFTAQQNAGSVTPPVGYKNYLGVTSSSAYTVGASESFFLYQPIEGYNIADLAWGTANAKTVTLSAWVYSSLTGTFGGSLQNNGSSRSYPFTYSIPVANTWTQISITIAGDTTGTWATTNSAGINVVFSVGAGSTVSNTAGAWVAGNYPSATGATSVVGTNGATFSITGVQLEVGSQATSFDVRSYGTELALCQRYYATCFWNVVTTALGYSTITTPVSMRTAPTIAGGGTGFAAVVSGAYSTIASQTSAGAQTLTFTAEL